MIDIVTHRIIDMIDSRDINEVTQWLKSYPNIQFVARDGSIAYRNAVDLSHPQAIQISDRFHLYKNLTDYCKDYLKKKIKSNVTISVSKASLPPSTESTLCKGSANRKLTLHEKYQKIILLKETGMLKTKICSELNMDIRVYSKLIKMREKEALEYFNTISHERSMEKMILKQERADEVKSLKQMGYSKRRIAKITGLSTNTVRKYLNPDFTPVHASSGASKSSVLNPYKDFIDQQLEQGIMSSIIEQEVRMMGYSASSSTLRHYCSVWKKRKMHNLAAPELKELVKNDTERISRKTILKLLYNPLNRVKSITSEQFEKVLQTCPAFAQIHKIVWEFKSLVSRKAVEELIPWIEKARNLAIKEINSFINGIERDMEAVKNAIKYDYSNGLAEGTVNKLKVIKRIMYGRCGFETLRLKTLQLERIRKIN